VKRAIIRLTKQVLEDFLPLPDHTRIIEVLPDDRRNFHQQTVEIAVEHDDLPEVREGELMMVVGVDIEYDDAGRLKEVKWRL